MVRVVIDSTSRVPSDNVFLKGNFVKSQDGEIVFVCYDSGDEDDNFLGIVIANCDRKKLFSDLIKVLDKKLFKQFWGEIIVGGWSE